MIIWLNGGFGAGKTALAEELHERIPDSVVYDPEDVGLMLWKWLPPNDDFQDLPSWREVVIATALSLRKHHAETLIVPMSLIHDAYRVEILGGLADAGEDVLHVFLEANRRTPGANRGPWHPQRPASESDSPGVGLQPRGRGHRAAARQPRGTLMLRSDRLTPVELADEVLRAAGLPRSTEAAVFPDRRRIDCSGASAMRGART